ncbi:MAG: sugar ABC transporter permease [Anaerolineae bacterium]|nr:sugar ABC transporter permease [Anaerolineae bacterium]
MASITTPREEISTPPRKPGLFGHFSQSVKKNSLAYAYILPALLLMAFITFYPLLYQVWMAFTNFELKHLLLQNPDFVGLDNFIQIFQSGLPVPNFSFGRILVFNILWTVVNVTLHVTIGIVVALALNAEELPGKRLYRSLFVIPWALPSLISGLMWANMWHEQFGGINLLIKELGGQGTLRWLLEPTPIVNLPQIGLVLPLSFFAVLITNVWLGWPFMMVIATGALQGIPKDLYEAADVDGASGWYRTWKITLPLLRPAMVPAIIIGIMMTFNNFNVIYFVTGGGPFGLTEILVTQGFKLVNPQGWYGVASAFNIIVFFILATITLMTNHVSRATEPYYT